MVTCPYLTQQRGGGSCSEAARCVYCERDYLTNALSTARAEAEQLRSELAQRDRDWDALVKLIAMSVGTEEDRDCAENDEMAEFDPWYALRTRAAEAEQLRAERDAARWADETRAKAAQAALAERDEYRTQHDNALASWEVDRQNFVKRLNYEKQCRDEKIEAAQEAAVEAIASWLDRRAADLVGYTEEETETLTIACELRAGAWRTTKGDASKCP